MPIIPLLTNSQPLADAPKAVLDRERRPTVDNRGVLQAVGQLGAAMQQPLVNPEPFTAPYEALGSIGRAVVQAGSVLGALAIKRREAETDYQVATVGREMKAEQANLEKWKVDTAADPATWEAEWKRRTGAFLERLSSREDLNEGARAELRPQVQRWLGDSEANVTIGAAQETFRRARGAFDEQLNAGMKSLKPEEFFPTLHLMDRRGHLSPERKAKLAGEFFMRRGEQMAEQGNLPGAMQQYEALTANQLADEKTVAGLKARAERTIEWRGWQEKIEIDPLGAAPEIARLQAPENGKIATTRLSAAEVQNLQALTAVRVNTRRLALFEAAAQVIEARHVTRFAMPPKAIEARAATLLGAEPEQEVRDLSTVEGLQAAGQNYFRDGDIQRLLDMNRFADLSTNERVDLAKVIADYKASQDLDGEKRTDIQIRIRALPQQHRAALQEQFVEQAEGRGAVSSQVMQQLHASLQVGAFGNVKTIEGRALNPKEFDAAHARAAELQEQFRTWFKRNPDATPVEALKWLGAYGKVDVYTAVVRAQKDGGMRREKTGLERLGDRLLLRQEPPVTLRREIDAKKKQRDQILNQHPGAKR